MPSRLFLTSAFVDGTPAVADAPITLFARFKPLSTSAAGALISLAVDGGSYHLLGLRNGSVAAITRLSAGAQNWAQVTAKTYVVGQWHSACGVYRAANTRSAYIDGEHRVNHNTAVNIVDSTVARIGGRGFNNTSDELVDALIRGVAIWNVELTDSEIRALHTQDARNIRPNALVHYFPDMGELGRSEYDVMRGVVFAPAGTGAVNSLTHPDPRIRAPRGRHIFLPISASSEITLAVQDATHGHSSDFVDLTQANALAVADAAHTHTVDNISLTQANVLSVADAVHAHLVDILALVPTSTLTVEDATHAHTVDSVTLSEAAILIVADALHAHTADGVTLIQAYVLAVAKALHQHLVRNLDLTQASTLVVSDALHLHFVDSPLLRLPAGFIDPAILAAISAESGVYAVPSEQSIFRVN